MVWQLHLAREIDHIGGGACRSEGDFLNKLHQCINQFRPPRNMVIRSYKVHSRPKVCFNHTWLNCPVAHDIVKELADVLWVYCNQESATLRVSRAALWQVKFRRDRDYLLDVPQAYLLSQWPRFRFRDGGKAPYWMKRSRRMGWYAFAQGSGNTCGVGGHPRAVANVVPACRLLSAHWAHLPLRNATRGEPQSLEFLEHLSCRPQRHAYAADLMADMRARALVGRVLRLTRCDRVNPRLVAGGGGGALGFMTSAAPTASRGDQAGQPPRPQTGTATEEPPRPFLLVLIWEGTHRGGE